MKNKTIKFLIVVAASFTAANLTAGNFEKDLTGIEGQLQGYRTGMTAALPAAGSAPAQYAALSDGNKWWSVNIAGSGHKAAMKAALAFIDRNELPDMARVQDILMTGANDESAHLPDTKVNNGGKPEEVWYGKAPYTLGGVLWNYTHFKFPEAYAKLGTICHLTQDQAVPSHAANIRHYTNDSFEGHAAEGNKVKLTASRDNGEMDPYAYYQDLQDETRRHLASWVHPKTGKPYWVPAKNAPPLGVDATFGPWGSYGPDGDVYSVRENDNTSQGGNNNQQVTASPEIRIRQLTLSAAATAGVLKSAARRLPPLVSGLAVTPAGKGATVKFTILDNRSGDAGYSVALYREGEPAFTVLTGRMALQDPAAPELMLKGEVSAELDLSSMAPGSYVIEVRVTDGDGNTVPEEVNQDDIATNDTRAPLTIP